MNEKDVLKQSKKVFMIGLVIFGIVSCILQSASYILGFILGYVINILIFNLIIKTSDMILNLQKSVIPIVMMTMLKLVLYGLGFILAIFYEKMFNIIGVFFGYMVIKITIHILGYFTKGGERRDV